jgi:hypothetical protein
MVRVRRGEYELRLVIGIQARIKNELAGQPTNNFVVVGFLGLLVDYEI